jgi:hypothetical protein
MSSDLVISEFTLVLCPIYPDKLSFTMKKSVLKITLESVTFSELASALSMVDFTDLNQWLIYDV